MTILPCPFCDTSRVSVAGGKTLSGAMSLFVKCVDCEARGPFVIIDDHDRAAAAAIDEWNRRRNKPARVSLADRDPIGYYETLVNFRNQIAAATDPRDRHALRIKMQVYRLSANSITGKGV